MRQFGWDGKQRGFSIVLETGTSTAIHRSFFVERFEVDQGMLWFMDGENGERVALNLSQVKSIERVPF